MSKHSPEEGGTILEFKTKEQVPLSQEDRQELSGIYHRLAELREEAEYMEIALGLKTEKVEEAEKDSFKMRVLKPLADRPKESSALMAAKKKRNKEIDFKNKKGEVGEGYELIKKEMRELLKRQDALEARLPAEELIKLQEVRKAVRGERWERKEEAEAGAHEIVVQNATNPFREALLKSGIPDIEKNPLAQEKRDILVNLAETLKSDQDSYRSAGLIAWADNLNTVDWSKLTPDKRQIIEQEIKDGAIPIFMPDRATQLATTVEDYTTRLKPLWIKDGQPQPVAHTSWWDYFQKLIANKAAELVADVPDRPYLSFQKPTQKPEERTTDKTVAQQLQEFAKMQKERQYANRASARIANPAEYGALQKRFTEQVSAACAASQLAPVKLNPLDSETWTRFINLPLSSGGRVPYGGFLPGVRLLYWGWSVAASPVPGGGFRLAVGVEL